MRSSAAWLQASGAARPGPLCRHLAARTPAASVAVSGDGDDDDEVTDFFGRSLESN